MLQVKEKKPDLAKLETSDMGKPIQEAEWDMVRSCSLHCTCTAILQADKLVHRTCSPVVLIT